MTISSDENQDGRTGHDGPRDPSIQRRRWSVSLGVAAVFMSLRALAARAPSTVHDLSAAEALLPAPVPNAPPGRASIRLGAASPAALRNGYLETLNKNGQVTGWAAPSGVVVTIIMDNAVVGTVTASLPRPDVEGAGYGPNTGWAFRLPAADPKRPHSVRAIVADKPLNGSLSFGADAASITDPARQIGGVRQGIASTVGESDLRSHPSVVFFADFSSDNAIKSQWVHADAFYNPGPSLPTINNPGRFSVDAGSGIRMIEIPIDGRVNGVTGTSWYRLNNVPLQELYCRYLLMIDPDVNVGMNELGVKLPGMAGMYERVQEWNYDGRGNRAVWSGRLEHGPQTSPGVYRLKWYWYGADHPVDSPDRGALMLCDCSLRAGQTYCIEQHIKLNTQAADQSWNADGVLEVYVDGVRVYHDSQAKIRADARAMFQDIPFANFYHGGNTPPKSRIHYRFGGVVTAKEYIGPPRRV